MKTPLAVLAAIAVVAGGMLALPVLSAGQAQAQQQKWTQHGGKGAPRAAKQQRARGGRNAAVRNVNRGGRNAAVRNANRGGRNVAVRNAKRGGRNVAVVRGGNRNTRVVHARYGRPPAWRYGHRYRGPYYGGRRWYGGGWYGGRWWGPGYYDNSWGAFGVGAAVGLATGAIVGAVVSDGPVYAEPSDTYYTGPAGRIMSRNDGGVIVSEVPAAGGYAPFSPGWVDYCSSKYRSFNPQTGMYLGYDGYRHYCQ